MEDRSTGFKLELSLGQINSSGYAELSSTKVAPSTQVGSSEAALLTNAQTPFLKSIGGKKSKVSRHYLEIK